jgi:hypothetical protein
MRGKVIFIFVCFTMELLFTGGKYKEEEEG